MRKILFNSMRHFRWNQKTNLKWTISNYYEDIWRIIVFQEVVLIAQEIISYHCKYIFVTKKVIFMEIVYIYILAIEGCPRQYPKSLRAGRSPRDTEGCVGVYMSQKEKLAHWVLSWLDKHVEFYKRGNN